MTYYYNLFLNNDLLINSQATRNLLGHPDLQSWVPGGATGKKFLNHRLVVVAAPLSPYCHCMILIRPLKKLALFLLILTTGKKSSAVVGSFFQYSSYSAYFFRDLHTLGTYCLPTETQNIEILV